MAVTKKHFLGALLVSVLPESAWVQAETPIVHPPVVEVISPVEFTRPAPSCVCPPGTIPILPPGGGKQGETPKQSETPKQPNEPTPAPPGPNQFAGATEAGTQPGAMFSPYMFGDVFGNSRSSISARVGTLIGQSFLSNSGATGTSTTITNPAAPLVVPITNSVIYASAPTNTNFTLPQRLPALSTSPSPINTTVSSAVNATQAYLILFPLPGVAFTGGAVPLQDNAAYRQYIDSVFKQRFGSNGQTVFTGGNLSAGAGSTGTPLAPSTSQVTFTPDSEVYFTYDYIAQLSVPLPSSGGVVGTTKLSENNSPMPRDRLIFDYDYFSNVPLTANGFNVSRFSPGFEKTFLDNRASVQLRLPFASTVDSSSITGGISNRATEFGNMHLTFKGLMYASRVFNMSTGLGVAIPTAADTRVSMADGSDLVRIKNQSWILTPFLAGLYTPNERFFAQVWGQVNVDVSGSPVSANPDFNGLVDVGRLYDQTLAQVDAQVGYWLIRNSEDNSFLTALAPFLELHYNTPLNSADLARSGSFTIGSSTNRYNELNLAAGVNMILRDRVTVAAGVVLPLMDGNDRFFDAQFGLRLNWLFGPSSPQTQVSSY